MRARLCLQTGFVVLAIAATGCHAARSQARSAVEAGDLRRALDLYDEAIESDPNDSEALRERRDARGALTKEILGAAERQLLTDAGDQAENQMLELCTRRDTWGEALGGTDALRFSSLRDSVQSLVLGRIDALAQAGRFLDASRVRSAPRYRCGDLAPFRQAIESQTAAYTSARCRSLEAAAQASGPYSQSVVERACIAMGTSPAAHVVLPHQVARVEVSGTVAGASDALLARMRGEFASAGTRSPLFDPVSKTALEVTVAGSVQQRVQRTPTTLSHDWVEQVPYQDVESYQESYQEPYTDTEYYNEQIPYTKTEYVNGRMQSHTEYRTERKQRTVTKYRLAWRTKTRPVTRYRSEPRVFTHAAVHIESTYQAAFTVELHTPLLVTVSVPVVHTDSEDAYEHSASFGPAGVSPSAGNVRSLDDRFSDDIAFTVRTFFAKWRQNFFASACQGGAFSSAESGAKCMWLGGSDVPDGAFLALGPLFGADVPALPDLKAP